MKIPKYIKRKMHRLARVYRDVNKLELELAIYFDKNGLDMDDLWESKYPCLAALEQGYDITDEFCTLLETDFEYQSGNSA